MYINGMIMSLDVEYDGRSRRDTERKLPKPEILSIGAISRANKNSAPLFGTRDGGELYAVLVFGLKNIEYGQRLPDCITNLMKRKTTFWFGMGIYPDQNMLEE